MQCFRPLPGADSADSCFHFLGASSADNCAAAAAAWDYNGNCFGTVRPQATLARLRPVRMHKRDRVPCSRSPPSCTALRTTAPGGGGPAPSSCRLPANLCSPIRPLRAVLALPCATAHWLTKSTPFWPSPCTISALLRGCTPMSRGLRHLHLHKLRAHVADLLDRAMRRSACLRNAH